MPRIRRKPSALRRKSNRPLRSKRAVAKLSSPVRKAITRIIHGDQETKYVATAAQCLSSRPAGLMPGNVSLLNVYLPTAIIAGGTLNTGVCCLPTLAQGTEQNQRVGISVLPIRHKTTVQLWLNHDYMRQISGTYSASCSQDWTVKLFLVTAKSIKKATELQNSAGTVNTLLMRGDGTEQDWSSFGTQADLVQSNYPVFKDNWNVHSIKYVRITKGTGLQQGESGNTIGAGNGVISATNAETATGLKTVTFSYKLPKLVYTESAGGADVYPNNVAPTIFAVVYQTQGQNTASPQSPFPDATGQYPIALNVWNEMYFKDA